MTERKPPAKKAAARKASSRRRPVTDKDRQILELRRAGVPVPAIGRELKLTRQAVLDGYLRALDETAPPSIDQLQVLAVDRLGMLIQPLWTKALRGDLEAAREVTHLIETQLRAGALRRLGDDSPGLVEAATLTEVTRLKLADHTLAVTALVLARSVDKNADRPLAAATVSRELRQTMSLLRGIAGDLAPAEPVPAHGDGVATVSRLDEARKKAQDLAAGGD